MNTLRGFNMKKKSIKKEKNGIFRASYRFWFSEQSSKMLYLSGFSKSWLIWNGPFWAQMFKNQTKGTLKGATALELYWIVDQSFIIKFFYSLANQLWGL